MARRHRGYSDRTLAHSLARESLRYADRERLRSPTLRGTARLRLELLVPPCIESIYQLSEQLFGRAWTPSLNSRTVCLFHPSPQIAYRAHRRPWCYRTVPTQTNPFHRDRQIRAHALPATRWGNNASAPSLTLNPPG